MAGIFNIVLRNSTTRVFAFAISTLVTLLLTPFLIHSLGDIDYGIWILVGSVGGLYSILDLGIGASIVRYVSRAYAKKDMEELNKTINTCLFIYSIIAVVVVLLTLTLTKVLPLFVSIPPAMEIEFTGALLIIGLGIALMFPLKVFGGVLDALMRQDIQSGINIAFTLIQAILIVLTLKAEGGLIGLATVTFIATLFSGGLNLYFAFRICPPLKLGWSFIERGKIREILGYSAFRLINMVGDILRFRLDSIIIGSVLSLSAITPYSIAQRMVRYFMLFVGQIFGVTMPLYSSYETKKDTQSIHRLFLNSTFYSSIVAFFIASLFIVYGETFIALWIGTEYAQKGYIPLLILTICFTAGLSQNPSINLAYGMERHKVIAIVTVLEGIANLVLSLALARKMGLVGVALGTAIPMIIAKGFIQPVYICHTIGISLSRYIKECFLTPAAVTAIFLTSHIFIKRYLYIETFYQLIFAVALSGCVFLLLTISLLNEEQRIFWKGRFIQIKQKLAS